MASDTLWVNRPCVGCWICGDPDDHDGEPHSKATGDGLTRYDCPDGPAVPAPEPPEHLDPPTFDNVNVPETQTYTCASCGQEHEAVLTSTQPLGDDKVAVYYRAINCPNVVLPAGHPTHPHGRPEEWREDGKCIWKSCHVWRDGSGQGT